MSVVTDNPAEALRRFVAAAPGPPAEPYRNLEPFRFADAGILAARDREVERLVRLITMYRGVLLYGASGVGKTSVVNAGLLPRMLTEGYWPHRVRVAPRRGQEFVLEAISAADGDTDAFLPSAFSGADEHGRLVVSAGEFPQAVAAATELGAILLVFDQFEELVTLFPHTVELRRAQADIVQAIVELLYGGAVEPGHDPREPRPMLPVKLMFSFREDYLAGLRLLLDAQPELVHQSLRILPPPQSAATAIIRAPFDTFPGEYPRELSVAVAQQIADALADDSDGDDPPLSELQIVCSRLWHEADPAALLAQRGVSGLVEDYLEDAVRKFEGEDRDAAIAVLSQLVTSSNTRNIVARPDLVQRAHDMGANLGAARIDGVIGRLETESGLIRRERRYDLDLYEITSEFLIPWISRQRTELAADRARREQEARLRRQQRLTLAIVGILVIIAVCALLAVFEAVHAHHEQSAAQTANRQALAQGGRAKELDLATTAQTLLGTRPNASLILALAAYHDNSALPAAQTSILAAFSQAQLSGATGILHGSGNTVTAVAFDPGATHVLASGSADGTIRLWDSASNRQLQQFRVPGHDPGGVFSLAFGRDGRWLAAGGQSGTVWLWHVSSSGLVSAPQSPAWQDALRQGLVNSLSFSPDHRWLAAAGLDARIELESLSRNGAPSGSPRPFPGASPVRSIAFSPDSRTLASVGNTGLIQRWRVDGREPEGAPADEHTALYTVAFAPHADEFAAAGLTGNIYLWNTTAPAPVKFGPDNGPAINSIAFSPNGRRLAAGNADDAVQLWTITPGGAVSGGPPLTGQEGIVTSVAFSPSGHTLAAGSTDQTIRLWPIPFTPAYGHVVASGLGSVDRVAFGPSGRFAAAGHQLDLWTGTSSGVPAGPVRRVTLVGLKPTASIRAIAYDPVSGLLASAQGTTVRLWDQSGHELGSPLQTPHRRIFTVAFSHDGKWLAYGGQGHITLWGISGTHLVPGTRRQLQIAHVFSLAFAPSGTLLAAGGEDRTIRLLSVPQGHLQIRLTGDSDAVNGLAFNPHGTILASGSDDNTVRLWDVARGTGQALIGSHGYVRDVAFNRTGTILASASVDGTIRLWNAASGAEIGEPLSVDGAQIESVTFTPDGTHIVAGEKNGVIRTWPVPQLGYGALRSHVCSLLGTGLSPAEWRQAAPGIPPEDPCSGR